MTYDFETDPRYEPYLNYSLGVFAAGCALISTLLNPLILYVYFKRNNTIKNFLFKLIAVSDFLTNILPAPFIGYVFLSSEMFDKNTRYTFLNQAPEFLCCTFGCISQVAVTLMALTRMIKIIRPFYRIKFKWVMRYIIFYAVYMVLGNAGFLVFAGVHGQQKLEDFKTTILEVWIKYVCFTMNMLHCCVGIACSFITVVYLWMNMRKIGGRSSKLRSSHTIMIMNIPYLISVVINFLVLKHHNIRISMDLVNHYIIPIFTSSFNPCVIIVRSKALKLLPSGVTKSNPNVSQGNVAN